MRQIVTLLTWNPRPYEERRCCSDEPQLRRPDPRPSTLSRWTRKFRVALASSFAVTRRTVTSPIDPEVEVGTRVVTNHGREVGRVRGVLVDLPSGSTSYAVQRDGTDATAPVILLPRSAVGPAIDPDVAIVDERDIHVRRSA